MPPPALPPRSKFNAHTVPRQRHTPLQNWTSVCPTPRVDSRLNHPPGRQFSVLNLTTTAHPFFDFDTIAQSFRQVRIIDTDNESQKSNKVSVAQAFSPTCVHPAVPSIQRIPTYPAYHSKKSEVREELAGSRHRYLTPPNVLHLSELGAFSLELHCDDLLY